jgi:hypothetical protein
MQEVRAGAVLWVLLALGLLAVAGPAAATHESIPPGNAGVGQYTENVPGAGGDKPIDDGGGGSGGSGSGPDSEAAPPPKPAQKPESEGSAGQAADPATPPRRREDGSKRPAKQTPGGDGGSAVDDVVSELAGSDSGGMGIGLPIILGASLLAALGLVLAHRRRRAGTPEE